ESQRGKGHPGREETCGNPLDGPHKIPGSTLYLKTGIFIGRLGNTLPKARQGITESEDWATKKSGWNITKKKIMLCFF
ncbi:MAG: hypothetical protein J6T67_07450, partial [Paludibacteraceae bacterium]|nr:hypothetical protein [Paludibacteraceae bacterium]